jgi:hypothetical protein
LIISFEDAKKIKFDITQEDLDGLEQSIRNYTSNNFQNRNIRLEGAQFTTNTITSVDDLTGFREGQTIQVSNSRFNDGLFVIKSINDDLITFADNSFINQNAPKALVTLVEYPADILSGVRKLLKYDSKMGDKIGVKSETVSRMSKTYYDVNSSENIEGYPAALMAFLNKYKKLRWS